MTVQREESVRRHAQMVTTLKNQRDYVFTPLSVEELLRQTTGERWQRGPLVLELLLPRKWQVARHFVRGTWSHI